MDTYTDKKNSGVYWLGEIPSHWKVMRLKDIADLRSGDGITSDDISPTGEYPVFGGNGLRGYTDSYNHEGYYPLIGRQGALCGNINYAKGKFWASEHAVVVSAIIKYDTLWLGELLRVMNLNQYSNAAAQPGLAVDRIRFLRIPFPPYEEQERIAAYLDASCTAIDATIAVKRKQIEALDAVRGSLIEEAVTKGIHRGAPMKHVNEDWITEIPTHWDVYRIKRIVSRVDYGISQSTESEGRHPVLKMGHIQRGEIEFRDLDFVDNVADGLVLETGDLLYNRTNSPDQVAKAAVFRRSKSDAVTFASYLVRLRTNHRADPYFLNYLVNSNGFLSFARKLAIPSVQQSNLNSTRYCRIFVPCPPIEEQREIATYLDEKVHEAQDVADSIQSQIDTLTAYRKSLIHECVTGKRRIAQPELTQKKAYA